MKRGVLQVWLFIAAIVGPAAAQELVTPSDRVVSHVNIRSGPTIEDPEIGTLPKGESLPLVGDVPRWYQVELPDGRRGFVSKAWTRIYEGLTARKVDELRIHFLNVGAGTCTVVECPGANAPPMIVDCGSTGRGNQGLDRDQTRDYVQNILSTYTTAPNVVLSHGDVDHYSYVAHVLGSAPVTSIWQGGEPHTYTDDGFPTWVQQQRAQSVPIRSGFPSDWHNGRNPVSSDLSCGDASTFVLTVNTGTAKNAQSLVLMVEYGSFTAIFSGDAEGVTEAQASENFPQTLKATVLTASHHGANTHRSNSAEWIAATDPDVVIFSSGTRHFHPSCAAMNRFDQVATVREHEVWCGEGGSYRSFRTAQAHYVTEVSGAIVITSNGRSPVALHCTRTVECASQVSY